VQGCTDRENGASYEEAAPEEEVEIERIRAKFGKEPS
jgi:hypothetical protein